MYRFFWPIVNVIIKLIFNYQVIGANHIPAEGAAVLVANHISMFDPVAIALASKRPIHFMAKAELFDNAFLRWLFTKLHAFPVKRGEADRQAIRTALEVLHGGELLGIFPEGTRNKEEDLLPIHNGAALLALKTESPLIPIVVKGTKKLRFRQQIIVNIGEPIIPLASDRASKETLNQISNQIFTQLTHLSRQEFNNKERKE